MLKALLGLLFGSIIGRLISFILTIVLGYVVFMFFFNPRGLEKTWNNIKSKINMEKIETKEIKMPEVDGSGIKKEFENILN